MSVKCFRCLLRLWRVWQGTLNFSEAQIQGPQGWDLLLSWVFERVKIKKLVKGNKLKGSRKGQGGGDQDDGQEDEDGIEIEMTSVEVSRPPLSSPSPTDPADVHGICSVATVDPADSHHHRRHRKMGMMVVSDHSSIGQQIIFSAFPLLSQCLQIF